MKLILRDELRTTLSDSAYRAKHIPTSLHFETVEAMLAALDRADEIVVYCADVNCAASIYVYRLLEREGYAGVRRYAGGIADWENAGYPLEQGAPGETAMRSPAAERMGASGCSRTLTST